MEEPVKTPPPDNQVSVPPAPAHENSAPAKDVPAFADNTLRPPTDRPAGATATPDPAPQAAPKTNSNQGNVSKKPILVIVVSMVLFGALCAVAVYAYGRSN